MLNITTKTKREALVTEILSMRIDHVRALTTAQTNADALAEALTAANRNYENAQHKIATLETDRDNLLGALRVMADSSRVVRIRKSSIRDADMAMALPSTNTDKL